MKKAIVIGDEELSEMRDIGAFLWFMRNGYPIEAYVQYEKMVQGSEEKAKEKAADGIKAVMDALKHMAEMLGWNDPRSKA